MVMVPNMEPDLMRQEAGIPKQKAIAKMANMSLMELNVKLVANGDTQ
jgi:hypothetical protein